MSPSGSYQTSCPIVESKPSNKPLISSETTNSSIREQLSLIFIKTPHKNCFASIIQNYPFTNMPHMFAWSDSLMIPNKENGADQPQTDGGNFFGLQG